MGIEEEIDSDNYKGSSPEKELDAGSGTPEPFNDESTPTDKLTGGSPKIKFIPTGSDYDGKNGDAKIDIKLYKKAVGMGKEELMKYANDPFWIRLRLVLFIAFWLVWIAMLVGAIAIVILTPKCAPKPQNDWWQQSTFQIVNAKSFKDSNGDGKGDLNGLSEKAEYFKDIGVGSLLLSPIYESPNEDNGYDISDYMNVDPSLGTLEDFDKFIDTMKKLDIKVILDFVPNHSSKKHAWFAKSENKEEGYEEFYIWRDANGNDEQGNPRPPNNWLSVYGNSAWQWSPKRKQFYLHQFHEYQPDLNLNNEIVKEKLKNILSFWLEHGVDGFRVDAVSHLYEDPEYTDEIKLNENDFKQGKYSSLQHDYTLGLPKVLSLLSSWKQLLNDFTSPNNTRVDSSVKKILIVEADESLNNTMKYYGTSAFTLAEIPLNLELLKLNQDSTAKNFADAIVSSTSSIPSGMWPNWVLGSRKVDRLATRFGSDLTDGLMMVTLLNKGTPIVYYGDELGIESSRGDNRNIMPWSNSTNAGFTSSSPWLPVNDDYQNNNVESQNANKYSHLNIFKKLSKIRQQDTIQFGEAIVTPLDDVLVLLRVLKGNPGYIVAFNLGHNDTIVDLSQASSYVPDQGDLELHSSNVNSGLLYNSRSKIKLKALKLGMHQAVVLTFVPDFN